MFGYFFKRKAVLVYITGVNFANNPKSMNLNKTKNQNNYSYTSTKLNIKNSGRDNVSFGVLDPVTAAIVGTILQEAAEASAKGYLGIKKLRNTINKAEALFDRFDVKPAIETAMSLDLRYNLNSNVNTNKLFKKAVTEVKKLSDEHLVNRDLKHRVIEHYFFEDGNRTSLSKTIEDFFINLDNSHHKDFKKYLLSKLANTGKGLLNFEDIDSALKGVGDEKFRNQIKLRRSKDYDEYLNLRTDYERRDKIDRESKDDFYIWW